MEAASDGGDTHDVPQRRLLARLSIQSKLMLMLMASSIVSISVILAVGYAAGHSSMRNLNAERLIELRESQKRAVQMLFADLTNSLIVYSHDPTTVQALHAFTAGFDQLDNATITPAQQQAIAGYYRKELIQPTDRVTGDNLDINLLLPSANAQKYLQAYYTAPSIPERASRLDDAGDGSAWSAANAQFNDHFRDIVTRFEYGDALLLDMRGNVVYCSNKDADLGTNILTGPYRESTLRKAYEKALGANDVDFVWITDFQPYQPARGVPTAWLVSPVGTRDRIDGVLALPMPIAKINRIMTADKGWEAAGMGTTAETYLAGPDGLMRSLSRVLAEDPRRYQREAVATGTPPDVAERAIRLGGTTLVQPVTTAALRAAQRGETGTVRDTDYLGRPALEAYTPLIVPHSDLHWSILATRNDSEVFAREQSFVKTLVLTTAAIITGMCLVSLLLAQIFLRPIRRLQTGTQRISSGDYDVAVPITSHDEIGNLTAAFNKMSRSLANKEELLNEQRRENDRLLLALMPEPVAQRYRHGEQPIAQDHPDVCVIFADLVGLDEVSTELSGDELVGLVDELFRQFDAAAEALGVERIRTLHNGYLAGCGVTTPRLDSVSRTIEFAREMQRIVDRLNGQFGRELGLRAGISTGKVVSGLVGRSSVVYDMWGAAVSLAYQIHGGAAQPGIYVTESVHELMKDTCQFSPAGSDEASEQQTWRLSEQQ